MKPILLHASSKTKKTENKELLKKNNTRLNLIHILVMHH